MKPLSCRFILFALAIVFSPAAYSVLQCEQPGDPTGVTEFQPPKNVVERDENQALEPPVLAADLNFGHNVSYSEDVLAVGEGRYGEPGQVHLYRKSGGNWSLFKTLTAATEQYQDAFSIVSINGEVLAVGAPFYCAGGGDCKDGAVYLYGRDQGGADNWGFIKRLTGNSRFGLGLVLKGSTLAVYAPSEEPNVNGSGAVHIFEKDAGGENNWGQVKRLVLPESADSTARSFGRQLELADDQLIVGAGQSSEVFLYERDTGGVGNWGLRQSIPVPCETLSMAFDGERLVLNSAEYTDYSTLDRNGGLVFYESSLDGEWSRVYELAWSSTSDPGDDIYPGEIDIAGDTVLVGDQFLSADASEAVVGYLVRRNPTTSEWEFSQKLITDYPAGLLAFDTGVALAGKDAIVAYGVEEVGGFINRGVVFSYAVNPFTINPRLNDAWVFDDVPRQGFLFTVLPQSKLIFLAWFTFDTERPAASVTANLGEPGHRWLTALGPFDGTKALLDIEVTSGGVFDSDAILPGQAYDGTIELEFDDCRSGTFTYNIPSLGLSRTVSISRAVDENVAECEAWNQ